MTKRWISGGDSGHHDRRPRPVFSDAQSIYAFSMADATSTKRPLTAYNKFVRSFAKKHNGRDILVHAGEAWQKAKKSMAKMSASKSSAAKKKSITRKPHA
jgi:hypothetical protein